MCLERALQVAPREALVVHELAAFLVCVRHDAPAAYKVVRQGLQVAPAEPRLLLALARILVELDQPAAALKVLTGFVFRATCTLTPAREQLARRRQAAEKNGEGQ